MIIPWQDISADALENLIKEYIYRELEEHQADNMNLEQWIEQIKLQLKQKQIVVEWSELTETVNLVPIDKYQS
ncbi:YheU family protein [Pleionea sp. CnH1-48]|uniref:YheU family protein n=1 Tax=Pleionea sp. CnH1-48 TaxID=2954494 RepID=UPI002097A519|nr:YheU family protein [Pleionea sp. CnH1-48]MCO7224157.1 YheU family protein [Pleionea sp. CnH1-48]